MSDETQAVRGIRVSVRDRLSQLGHPALRVSVRQNDQVLCEARTDENGRARFDLSATDFPDGDYQVVVSSSTDVSAGDEVTVRLSGDKCQTARLVVTTKGFQHSMLAGSLFLAGIILFGISTVWCYISLHQRCGNTGVPINAALSALIEQTERRLRAGGPNVDDPAPAWCQWARGMDDDIDSPVDDSESIDEMVVALPERAPTAEPDAEIGRLMSVTLSLFETVRDSTPIDVLRPERAESVSALLEFASARVSKVDHLGAADALRDANRELHGGRGFFWSAHPLKLLEIYFWALFATLIRMMISTGTFIRKRRFLKTAIWSQVTLIISVPVLAVLISFVISLLEIQIGLAGSEINLDLSDVKVSILVAAFIGFAPWRAWDFLAAVGDTFFSYMQDALRRRSEEAAQR